LNSTVDILFLFKDLHHKHKQKCLIENKKD
jgi:hypothetical protein